MQVLVNSGNCAIDSSGNGPYLAHLPSSTALALAASSATLNRYDLIIARIYDDQNPAIGSGAGIRTFSVEVWTGDGASGVPTVPTPSISSGYIPLAAVYVAKTVTSITQGNITDLRGPAISARGGIRTLYGVDATPGSTGFTAAGSFPGERRFAYGNYTFQDQVYFGANTDPTKSGWHGVANSLFYTASPVTDMTSGGIGSNNEICHVTVADPGVPYYIRAVGRARIYTGAGTSIEHRIHLDSLPSGPLVNWVNVNLINGSGSDVPLASSIPSLPVGPFTGAKTVYMSASVVTSTGSGWYTLATDGVLNILSVEITPAPSLVV